MLRVDPSASELSILRPVASFRPSEPGAINGGLFQRPQDAPHPVVYMDVPEIDAAILKVEAAGGTVVTPKTPIPGMGAYARVRDTEGNVVGLFQNGS